MRRIGEDLRSTSLAAFGVTLAMSIPVLLAGCGSGGGAQASTRAITDFTASASFYDSPFPSDHRLNAEGRVALDGFPNPDGIGLVSEVLELAERDSDGFGVSSGAFVRFTGPLDPSTLPAEPRDTLAASTPVFLIDVDPASPELGRRFPLYVGFRDDAGPLGATNLLAMLPVQGVPMRPGTRYAAGVNRTVRDRGGQPLAVSPQLAALSRHQRPAGMSEEAFRRYADALDQLESLGVPRTSIAALAVFTTGHPMDGMRALTARMQTIDLPAPITAWQRTDLFDDFCVVESRVDMPIFQQGDPPFFSGGGDISFDATGTPVQQGTEPSRLVVTLPRRPMPASGFPGMVFIRTGGGGDRPLVDRGREPGHGLPAIEPGEGPARYFARAGFAAISFDGPHGGLRNVTGLDEQLLVFNFLNPKALRDNVRESATEAVLMGRLFRELKLAPDLCPGLDASAGPDGRVAVDAARMGIMGHSMGATIAPLALATSEQFQVAVLSGEGGSYLENVLYKESPISVKPIATALLHYGDHGIELDRLDPFLSILQWAAEPADPPSYGRAIVREPIAGPARQVLMIQGIVDTYIMPSIANASTGSFGLDLAGDELEATVGEMLVLAGGRRLALPLRGNLTSADGSHVTGVVVQHREDGVEDGHEVAFQLDAPKRQYQCFLSSWADGEMPIVPAAGPAAGCGD